MNKNFIKSAIDKNKKEDQHISPIASAIFGAAAGDGHYPDVLISI